MLFAGYSRKDVGRVLEPEKGSSNGGRHEIVPNGSIGGNRTERHYWAACPAHSARQGLDSLWRRMPRSLNHHGAALFYELLGQLSLKSDLHLLCTVIGRQDRGRAEGCSDTERRASTTRQQGEVRQDV